MTEEELRARLHFNGNTLICNPLSSVYHNLNGVCELAMFTNQSSDLIEKICKFDQLPKSNYIVQINMQDKYFMSINSPIDIVNSCGDGRIEMGKIVENGILTIEPGCTIAMDEIRIRSHEHKYFNDTKIIFPQNDLHGLKFRTTKNSIPSGQTESNTFLIQNHEQDFRDLADRADELIQKESEEIKFNQIHYDNVTHSYAIFVIIFII